MPMYTSADLLWQGLMLQAHMHMRYRLHPEGRTGQHAWWAEKLGGGCTLGVHICCYLPCGRMNTLSFTMMHDGFICLCVRLIYEFDPVVDKGHLEAGL